MRSVYTAIGGMWRLPQIALFDVYLFRRYNAITAYTGNTMRHPILTATQVGRLLQSTRKTRALSQGTLASRIGLKQSRLSELELAPGDISVDQLLALLSNLGLEMVIQQKPAGPTPDQKRADW
jgi:HTH-type transcriptional regulator/antitoxin HipB